jgi:hypothetical protein
MHADQKLGEHPNHGFVNIFHSENVDTHLRGKFSLIFESA